ncbi:MAG: hypothetical protein IJ689_02280 [Alphaproteobacteria bacterium]|nr:hypothetical protein [Alphaproteobacteria bacterium]
MFKDKLLRVIQKIEQWTAKTPSVSPVPHKIKLLNLIFMPLGMLFYNFKSFIILCAVFAPLMTVLAYATDNMLICSFPVMETHNPFACAASNYALYFTFFALRLLLVAVFLKSWVKIAVTRQTVNIRELLVIAPQDWKLLCVFLGVLMVNVLPIFSVMALINRVPNPDWRIETLYFAVVSCGFWLPFLAIRFYCLPAFVAENVKLPSIKQIFNLSSDNGLKMLTSFVMLLIFCTLFVIYFMGMAEKIIPYNYAVLGIVSEVFYNAVMLAVMTIFMNYSITQQKELFNE